MNTQHAVINTQCSSCSILLKITRPFPVLVVRFPDLIPYFSFSKIPLFVVLYSNEHGFTFIKRVCEWFGTIEGSRDAAFLLSELGLVG